MLTLAATAQEGTAQEAWPMAQENGAASAASSLRHIFGPYMEDVSAIAELAGVIVIVTGGLLSLGIFLYAARHRGLERNFYLLRANLGRSILLGLEFMVAADIIRSVAIHPTWEGLGTLAAIVAIRTFLSMSLEVEIEGRWPWRRGERKRE